MYIQSLPDHGRSWTPAGFGRPRRDAAGDSPDNWLSNIGTGALIGGTLNGAYDGILTHLKISDKIKGLSDLIARRAATLSPDPSYALRTDKLKSALDALMNSGFVKGFETFI